MSLQVLIFVFDVQSSDVQKDNEKYQSCIETGIMKYSPGAMVRVFNNIIPDQRFYSVFSNKLIDVRHQMAVIRS